MIGQLARNSAVKGKGHRISGSDLLEYACSVVMSSIEAVGGRYVMIECRDKEKLICFYENNGFEEIARIPYGEIKMVQMVRYLAGERQKIV